MAWSSEPLQEFIPFLPTLEIVHHLQPDLDHPRYGVWCPRGVDLPSRSGGLPVTPDRMVLVGSGFCLLTSGHV